MTTVDDSEYLSLRDSLLADGRLHEDPSFPAIEASLGLSRDDIEWLRPKDICQSMDPPLEPQFFVDGRSRSDVRQGKQLADCWVAAAAACLSTAKQEIFDRLVPPDQSFEPEKYCGAFHFNFWHFGEWKKVIVDDRLPTVDRKLVFMQSLSPNEFWGALLEKAYAKLHGSYKNLEWAHTGDALVDFTSGVVAYHHFESEEEADGIGGLLMDAFQKYSMAAVATAGNENRTLENGLITKHAYSLINIDSDEGVEEMVCQLVNCKNDEIWKGDCVDGDPTTVDQKIHDLNKNSSSGVFWIDMGNMVDNFHGLDLCYTYVFEDSWGQNLIKGSWDADRNSGGDLADNEFEKNPQLIVQVRPSGTEAKLIVELTRTERRNDLTIGLYVYDQLPSTDTPLTNDFLRETQCLREINPTSRRCVVEQFTFSTDSVVAFILATGKPNVSAEFMVRLFCDGPVSILSQHNF